MNKPIVWPAYDGRTLATWRPRVFAAILDGLLLSVVQWLLVLPLVFSGKHPFASPYGSERFSLIMAPWPLTKVGMLMFALGALYRILLEGRDGQTVGKKAMGIRVIRHDGGGLGYGVATLRWAAATVVGAVVPLGLLSILWPLWDAEKQTFHDKIARTVVVLA